MAKTADKDITVKNAAGQTVLLVAAGQEIPDNIDQLKEENSAHPRITQAEDKAQRSSRGK